MRSVLPLVLLSACVNERVAEVELGSDSLLSQPPQPVVLLNFACAASRLQGAFGGTAIDIFLVKTFL